MKRREFLQAAALGLVAAAGATSAAEPADGGHARGKKPAPGASPLCLRPVAARLAAGTWAGSDLALACSPWYVM